MKKKTMKKKTIISLLLGIVLMMSCFVVACGDKKPKVNLVDFTNVTETVGLGENYVLPNGVVFDAEGNDYRVTYEVKDSAGEEVSVLNGRFKINEIGNAKYVITCYAEITEDYYITRTITLDVIDRTAPTITANNLPYAYVGQEYEIINVQVSDNSGESVTPVYAVKDESGADVTVTNGKFTPETAGVYTLTITATDSDGNVGEETASIYVRQPMGAYVIENFNDEYGLPVFSVFDAFFTDKPVVYHETFEGKTGVAEGTSILSASASYGPHWYFKFDSSFKKVGDFDYIYIKAYIKCANAEVTSVTPYNQNEALGDGTAVPVNEWVEIRLTKEDINSTSSSFYDSKKQGETALDCFYRKMTEGTGTYLFWFSKGSAKASDFTLYVDEIGYQPRFNPTVELQESYDLGEYLTINPTVDTDEEVEDYSVVINVTDPSGNAVTLTDNQFRIMETGEYTVELTYNSVNGYQGYNKYTFNSISTKEIVVDEYTGSPVQNDTITLPLGTIDGGEVTISVAIEGYNVAMATANTFVANVAGDYVVTYSSVIDGLTYLKNITITVSELPLAENMVNTLSGKVNVTDYTVEQDSTITWMYEFAGEYGVAKYEPKNWGFFGFKPMQDMSAYAGAKYLVVRMYVETADYTGTLWFGGQSGKCSTAIRVGEWVDYYFDASVFLTNWANCANNYYVYEMAMSVSKAGTFYIDELYVLYDCAAVGLTANVPTGKVLAGDTISVTLNNANNIAGVSMVVTAPNGTVVADASSFTAEVGVYNVSISKEGYLDYETSFSVERSSSMIDVNEVLDIKYVGDIDVYTSERESVIEYVAEYKGATGVAKFTAPQNWSYFGFKPVQDMSNFAGAKYLVMRMYIESVNSGCTFWFADTAEKCSTAIKTGEWVDYYFDGAFFLEKWSNSLSNFNTSHAFGISRAGVIYIDKVYVAYDCSALDLDATINGTLSAGETLSIALNNPNEVDGVTITVIDPLGNNVEQISSFVAMAGTYTITISKDGYLDLVETILVTRPVGKNEVLDVQSIVDMNTYMAVADAEMSYLEEFNGEQGVVKFTGTKTWPFYGFKPVQAMSNFAGAKYLVIRMYVEETSDSCKLWFAATVDKCITPITKGVWKDYYFDGAFFLEKWANSVESFAVKTHFVQPSAGGTFYISNIFVAYDCASLGLSATVPTTASAGDTLGVTLNNPNEVDGVTLTVKAPNGSTVANASSFVAEQGVYTVTISKEGYLDLVYTFTAFVTKLEVVSFDTESQLDNFFLGGSDNKTYLATLDDEVGVVQWTYTGRWPGFSFKPVKSMAEYADYQYIVIRAKIMNNADYPNYPDNGFWMSNRTAQAPKQSIVYNEWVTYVYDATEFKAVWTDSVSNATTNAKMWVRGGSQANTGCIYISDIYMTNDING